VLNVITKALLPEETEGMLFTFILSECFIFGSITRPKVLFLR